MQEGELMECKCDGWYISTITWMYSIMNYKFKSENWVSSPTLVLFLGLSDWIMICVLIANLKKMFETSVQWYVCILTWCYQLYIIRLYVYNINLVQLFYLFSYDFHSLSELTRNCKSDRRFFRIPIFRVVNHKRIYGRIIVTTAPQEEHKRTCSHCCPTYSNNFK